MSVAASWWTDNGAAVQAISTIVLVAVTIVYVALTRKIAANAGEQAAASIRQAKAAELQLEQAKAALGEQKKAAEREHKTASDALELQRKEARSAEARAESILIESVKARLSSLTPVCTVIWQDSPLTQSDESSIGHAQMDLFDRMGVLSRVRFVVRNDGVSPVLVTATAVALEHDSLTSSPDWVSSVKDEVLLPEKTLALTYRIEAPGWVFRDLGTSGHTLEFTFETKSPLTNVVDQHFWTGRFPRIKPVPGAADIFDHNANTGPRGSRVAYPKRIWPTGFDEA